MSVGSSTTEGTLSHGDGCVIKTKTSLISSDLYDQCDVTMSGEHAVVPPPVSMQFPLCYADGIMPNHLRDTGSNLSSFF